MGRTGIHQFRLLFDCRKDKRSSKISRSNITYTQQFNFNFPLNFKLHNFDEEKNLGSNNDNEEVNKFKGNEYKVIHHIEDLIGNHFENNHEKMFNALIAERKTIIETEKDLGDCYIMSRTLDNSSTIGINTNADDYKYNYKYFSLPEDSSFEIFKELCDYKNIPLEVYKKLDKYKINQMMSNPSLCRIENEEINEFPSGNNIIKCKEHCYNILKDKRIQCGFWKSLLTNDKISHQVNYKGHFDPKSTCINEYRTDYEIIFSFDNPCNVGEFNFDKPRRIITFLCLINLNYL
uniref:PIR Superfamily Protein n=1 Tax=Strongyloides papillosus TaxID=174720 RepID=A0A0N5CA22_STREA